MIGAPPGTGTPAAIGLAESRASREPWGATSTPKPEVLTKCSESSPASAQRSAQCPIRPRWPVLRTPSAAMPYVPALRCEPHRLLADRLAEAEPAVHGERDRRLVHDPRLAPGDHHAGAEPVHVVAQPDHAVRVVADQVGEHEVGRHDGRLLRRAPRRRQDAGCRGLERGCRNPRLGHRYLP